MAGLKKQVAVAVSSEMSPKIEAWLDRHDIPYEVEVVRAGKRIKLRVMAQFDKDEDGKRRAEMYKRFLERVQGGVRQNHETNGSTHNCQIH